MTPGLRYFGDPALRVPARPVSEFDDGLRQLAARLLETMRREGGIGLAAQQIGDTRSLCVVQVPESPDPDGRGRLLPPGPEMPMILANPRILRSGEALETCEEGCLSFPEITAPIERPAEIEVAYQDLAGEERTARLGGLLARAVQHEMDHLRGVLIVDRMSGVKRLALSGRLKRLRRQTRRALAGAAGE